MIRRIPLRALHIFFGIAVMIFFAVESLKLSSITPPSWVVFYLNDFLCIPIVSTICLHGVWHIKRNRFLRLDVVSILSIVVLFTVYFELYLPGRSLRYTGDILDVLCYTSGGLVFYGVQKLR